MPACKHSSERINMIKPKELEELFSSCEDSKHIGDICRAIGGQNVKLDAAQRLFVNAIIYKANNPKRRGKYSNG